MFTNLPVKVAVMLLILRTGAKAAPTERGEQKAGTRLLKCGLFYPLFYAVCNDQSKVLISSKYIHII